MLHFLPEFQASCQQSSLSFPFGRGGLWWCQATCGSSSSHSENPLNQVEVYRKEYFKNNTLESSGRFLGAIVGSEVINGDPLACRHALFSLKDIVVILNDLVANILKFTRINRNIQTSSFS